MAERTTGRKLVQFLTHAQQRQAQGEGITSGPTAGTALDAAARRFLIQTEGTTNLKTQRYRQEVIRLRPSNNTTGTP